MAQFPLTITRIQELLPGFRRYEFAPSPALRYEPGQFLTFLHRKGGLELRRSYSLLTVPGLDEAPAIGVRRIENGVFSRWLFERAAAGTALTCLGAAGLFRLPPQQTGQQYFFLAAGSGITPVMSLLRASLQRNDNSRLTLVYSNHDPSTTLFRQELQEMALRTAGRLRVHFLYSTDPDLRRARLTRDGLLRLLAEENTKPGSTWFYCCGPESYMRLCSFVLRAAGHPAGHIRREDFIPVPAPPPAPRLPDTAPRTVTLLRKGMAHRIAVAPPDTVLKAALRAGLELPYSCNAGRCGTCVARRISGNVWLSRNEVLTDVDLQSGLVLTCVAHPVGDGLILQLDNTLFTVPSA